MTAEEKHERKHLAVSPCVTQKDLTVLNNEAKFQEKNAQTPNNPNLISRDYNANETQLADLTQISNIISLQVP